MKKRSKNRGKSRKNIKLGEYDVADNIISQVLGIMFKPPLKRPLLFVFDKPQKKITIHSFFCLPFDIVYLNERTEVVKAIKEVEPFVIIPPETRIKWIIEMPAGEIDRRRIKKGMFINIKNG